MNFTIKKLGVGLAFIYLLIVPAYFSYIGKDSVIPMIAGVLALLILNMDQLSSFSLMGLLNAKMKEADKAIKEAYATVDHMNQLAVDLGKTILFTLNEMGKWPSDDASINKINERNRIVNRLKAMGLKPDQIKEASSYFLITPVYPLRSKFPNKLSDLGVGSC